MFKYVFVALAAASAIVVSATWTLVTTDHWPLNDKRAPASTVFAANRQLGRWLINHAEQPPDPSELAKPQAEPLTVAELKKAGESMKSDPRLAARLILNPGAEQMVPRGSG